VQINGAVTFAQRMIVRRGVNYANNSAIPLLDFQGLESFAPVPVFLRVSNPGGDQGEVSVALVTPRGTSAEFYDAPFNSVEVSRYFALSADRIQDGEYHLVSLFAIPPGDPTSARFTSMILRAPAEDTIALGPPLSQPTVTGLSPTSPVRLRAELASQSEYGSGVQVQYEQDDRSVSLIRTAASAGGAAPATWIVDIPDLASAGYDPVWGLQGGRAVDWAVFAFGGDPRPFVGGTITGDAQILGAVRSHTLPPAGSSIGSWGVGQGSHSSAVAAGCTGNARKGAAAPPEPAGPCPRSRHR
jgi:hypothetical protein